MADKKMIRLSQAARELNVGISTITETLAAKGFEVEGKANSKITVKQLHMLAEEFGVPVSELRVGSSLNIAKSTESKETDTEVAVEDPSKSTPSSSPEQKSDQKLPDQKQDQAQQKPTKPAEKKKKEEEEEQVISAKLPGLKVIDKIDLNKPSKNNPQKTDEKPKGSSKTQEEKPNKTPENKPAEPKNTSTASQTKDKQKPIEQNKSQKEESKPSPEKPTQPTQEQKLKKETPPSETKSPQDQKQTENPKPEAKKQVEKKPEKPETKKAETSIEKSKTQKPETKKAETPVEKSETQKPETKKAETPVEKQQKTPQVKAEEVKKDKPEPTPKANSEEPAKESTQEPKKSEKQESPSVDSKKNSQSKPETHDSDVKNPKDTSPKEDKPDTNLKNKDTAVTESQKEKEEKKDESGVIKAKAKTLKGLTILDKIELPVDKKKGGGKPVASSDDSKAKKKRKRKKKRIKRPDEDNRNNTQSNSNSSNQKQGQNQTPKGKSGNTNTSNNNDRKTGGGNRNRNDNRRNRNNNTNNKGKKNTEISEAEIQNQIKATLARMTNKNKGGKKSRGGRNRDRDNRDTQVQEETKLLQVTEFISANELANLMDVSVNEVISTCMNLGMFVSINQRLDAEAITFITDEFGYEVEFISTTKEDEVVVEIEDDEEDLEPRAPIVTIMGHVDHGKTSLLDYIRSTNVTAGESGGITQHIGAYDVTVEDGRRIAFLDTPGHEAFTAMRARGAKVTDIVILVVAADDSVMPQTKEAINHARVADVPIVIAINKVDKSTANADKIREELSKENVLVESWGGKYQDQEISAKTGQGIDELLEKVLLEAELLELQANPKRKAIGTVIEAFLDKGKGYVATVLVQSGTLEVGDVILAGSHYGKVKAMNDHRGKRVDKAGPATPVQVLGLDGAPQAGDVIKVMDAEREAREIATKREQILREQAMRATKGLTLEEIGRRRALDDFKELKIIVKGDVDGSVEALSDSLLKNSTEEIEVKIIHKGVGQISEADIMLASASEAIIVGFQVRPSNNAKKAAEQEKVQIKLYSVIYNAIEEIRDAMEGMLAPTVEEVIVGNTEVREVFKISKVGTVAGCYVTDGYIKKNNKIRLIRDGIVTYEGEIGALKRFKDDVMEVRSGYECGVSIKSFNDIKVGDVIESFEEREIKRTL